MTTLKDKLAEYEQKGAKKFSGNYSPTIMLTNDDDKEQYLECRLVERVIVDTQYGDSPKYTVEYISSDCSVRIKENKEWKDITVAAGDTVEFFAPTRLDRTLIKFKVGDQLVIGYTGREKKRVRGRNAAHEFVVQNLGGGTQPIASAAELAAASSKSEKDAEEQF